MSKKSDGRTALIEARVVLERAWVYERRIHDGMPWPAIRALALRPDEAGGIGRNYGVSTLRGMVAAHRADQGEVVGTREERLERRQHEYDVLALGARAALARAAAHRDEYGEPAPYLDTAAAKLLLDVRAAEARMHGDDQPTKIEAEVTTRDGVLDDLNAALAAIGVDERVKS